MDSLWIELHAEARRLEYDSVLSSARWRQLREEAHLATGSRCQWCGVSKEAAGHLELHHKTYRNLGREEFPKDVALLCPRHHRFFEVLKRARY